MLEAGLMFPPTAWFEGTLKRADPEIEVSQYAIPTISKIQLRIRIAAHHFKHMRIVR